MIDGPGSIARDLTELSRLAAVMADRHAAAIADIAALYLRTLRSGGTLYFAGNGGSAADAQHVAAEYVVRFARKRKPLPATAITTDTSVLTACANDFSFDEVFARQVEALAKPGDLLVLHSTSGESPNLLRAAEQARAQSVLSVAFLGKGGGRLSLIVDHVVIVPSDSTSRIQELHLAIQHAICGLVENGLAS
jgi:D-sedoheptulose 7-phosphate isomerase